MNLDLFDDSALSGSAILRERENSLNKASAENAAKSAAGSEASKSSVFPSHTPLGMAYVPVQQWGEVFSDEKALSCGTLFPDLVFPFLGGDCDE